MVAKTQKEIVADHLMEAACREEWLTVEEIASATGFLATSVSSSIRNLRKPHNGSFVILKRRRQGPPEIVAVHFSWLWEFKISC